MPMQIQLQTVEMVEMKPKVACFVFFFFVLHARVICPASGLKPSLGVGGTAFAQSCTLVALVTPIMKSR